MNTSLLQHEEQKRSAAARAVREINDGMVVGLGSGSTATFAVEALAGRIANGLRIIGIPTSKKTAALARKLNIPLTDFATHRHVDVTIDGADQVARGTLDLVKGQGGALLREKIVACASKRMVVVVDETKLVDQLGARTSLPIEIVRFGWETVLDRLAAIGCVPLLRHVDGQPFMTDDGNYIADCAIGGIADPAALQAQLLAVVGVIETGLFVGIASQVVVGRAAGVDVIERIPK
jgi:ribose 5-phosphate isomerase A